MDIVDFILNLAGVLLWVNWRMTSATPRVGTPTTLLGTLRHAEPVNLRRWYFLAALPLLLTVRAWLYWEIGGTTTWAPSLNLGVMSIAFRSDLFQRAFFYSVLSFGAALGLFYLWLLLLSVLNRRPPKPDPFGRFVRLMLGPIDRLAPWMQLLLPLLLALPAWWGLSLLLDWMNVLPPPESFLHRIEQGLLMGLGACLTWSHLLAGILLLHLVNTYVHLGEHPLWAYIHSLARSILAPFRAAPLRLGKVDFAPVVALALVYLAARGADHLLTQVYRKLPL
jgi:uncharacterized protein YggT (Ycf19 family)